MIKQGCHWLIGRVTSSRSVKKWGIPFSFFCLASLLLITALACGTTAPVQTTPSPSEPGPAEPSLTVPPASELPADIIPGDNSRSLVYAGVDRSYILHIPPGFDNSRPVALMRIISLASASTPMR